MEYVIPGIGLQQRATKIMAQTNGLSTLENTELKKNNLLGGNQKSTNWNKEDRSIHLLDII